MHFCEDNDIVYDSVCWHLGRHRLQGDAVDAAAFAHCFEAPALGSAWDGKIVYVQVPKSN